MEIVEFSRFVDYFSHAQPLEQILHYTLEEEEVYFEGHPVHVPSLVQETA